VIFDQAWVFATSARSFQECAVEWSARRSSSGNAGGGEPIVAGQRGSKEPPIVAEGQSAEGLSELSVTRAALWRERCSAKRGITVGRTGGRRRGAILATFYGRLLTHFWLLLDLFSVESGRMKAVAAVRRKGANNVEVSLSSIPGSTTVRMAPLATATSLSTFMARAQMAANKMFNM
jgi:hypothetical protein